MSEKRTAGRRQLAELGTRHWKEGFSVPRCSFASDGIFDRFQLLCFFFLTPETLRFGA